MIPLANLDKKRKKWEEKVRKSNINEIDKMPGKVFEDYLKLIFKSRGYKVHTTKTSGDFGADLILTTGSRKIVVQVKRYKNKVGLQAVQEVVSSREYYHANECWVITNNYFTAPAEKLAAVNRVNLINREELIDWITDEKRKVE